MSSLGSPNPFFIAGKKAYEIERSLRFNDNDTAYLSRNFGTGGNRKKWTFSAWIKRGNLGGSAGEMRIFGGSTNASHIFITSNDALTWDVAAPGSSASANLTTTQKFRDPSAWFHLVCALDTDNSTADNRMRIYINGTEVTSFGTRTNPSSGYAANAINADAFADGDRSLHTIGYRTSVQGSAGMEFDGYMAEINFIDGQQYDPSYFGETNPITGQWNPKKYVGGYGTTGFYLNFSDNSGTTATTLGKDSSGNSNNWTPNNFSVAAGVGNDSLEDTPTNNFCTLSPLTGNGTNFSTSSNGNLDFSCASGTGQISYGSMLIPETGKWYAEVVFSSGGQHSSYGVRNPSDGSSLVNLEFSTSQEQIRADNSYLESSTESWGNGNVLGIKVDRDAGTIQFAVDGTNASTAINLSEMDNSSQLVFSTSRTEGGGAHVAGSFNFGQRPFSHLPTDYKSLCTANLDDPTIKIPNKHFNIVLYSGDGNSTKSITGVGFQPDWLWLKGRNTNYSNLLYNSVVGAGLQKGLNSNETRAEGSTVGDNATYGYVNSFDSDGFSVTKGSDSTSYTNGGSSNYVAWNWKGGGSAVSNSDGTITSSVSVNASAGFSIVSYTGTGSDGTIGHGLGVAPSIYIVKRRNSTKDWYVQIGNLSGIDLGRFLKLNTTDGINFASDVFAATADTSTVLNTKSDSATNGSGDTYIAYCFSEVAGFSKFGTYAGNGNGNGPFVYTGFRPAYVVVKSTSGYSWDLRDSGRDPYNEAQKSLSPNLGNAESSYASWDFCANGFKLRGTSNSLNKNGNTYVYLAFAESPFKYARAR